MYCGDFVFTLQIQQIPHRKNTKLMNVKCCRNHTTMDTTYIYCATTKFEQFYNAKSIVIFTFKGKIKLKKIIYEFRCVRTQLLYKRYFQTKIIKLIFIAKKYAKLF